MPDYVLELPDEELTQKIWNEFGLNRQSIKDAVEILNNWLEQQPHLPKERDDGRMERWLLRCKNSIENTKQVLDLYYTFKAISPEFMEGWDTNNEWFHILNKTVYIYPSRKLTEDGDRVTVIGLFHTDANEYSPVDLAKVCLMGLELRTCEDYWRSDILVIDLSKITVQHVSKITLSLIKKVEGLIMKGYKLRLKSAHVLNVPSYAQIIVNMFKAVLKPKLATRIHLHGSDLTEMYTHVPKKLLPLEYGGEAGTIAENNAQWKKKMESYREWFLEQDKLKSDETKRPGDILNSSEIFGFEGSFRKLDLD